MASARRRRWLWWTLIPSLVVALVAVGGVFVALKLERDEPKTPAYIPPRPALIAPVAAIAPVNASAPEPSSDGLARALVPAVDAPALGRLTGEITDALTATPLWSQNATTPMVPASTTKILTAAAALLSMPLDTRLTTTVVAGSDGTVVLVGGGDPTLTAQPLETSSLFTNPPRVADLAAQIRAAGITPTAIAVDSSGFSGPSMAPTWETADISGGNIAPIQSVMIDAGRTNPADIYSPRTATPAQAAGQALAADLGLPADAVRDGTAQPGAKVIATVSSAPLSQRLVDMMSLSDDVMAETIGIEVSRATGGPASLAGAVAAVQKVLTGAKFDMSGVRLLDVNGLSVGDRIPASLLSAILESASGPTGNAALRPLLDTLPVAAATGTLADRFSATAVSGAGWVRAKTGTLTGVSTLAGIVQTVDNRVLVFSLMSAGTSPADARPALDDVATTLRKCGCR